MSFGLLTSKGNDCSTIQFAAGLLIVTVLPIGVDREQCLALPSNSFVFAVLYRLGLYYASCFVIINNKCELW